MRGDLVTAGPVLLVGHGLIGAAVRARLVAAGCPVICVARSAASVAGYMAHDLSGAVGLAALRAELAELRPRCVVLAHGPSSVTWIEGHEQEAGAVHGQVARIVADSGSPAVLVSTDNVFSGATLGYRPSDEVRPANAYGRIKARAEDLLLASQSALVLRVSLVYGWSGSWSAANFAERCLRSALGNRVLSAPTDQTFTPVHVRDVVAVLAALCTASRPFSGIRHLAGPQALSRYDFARLAYARAEADTSLVRPCLRHDTEWRCRPRFSSLECGDFTDLPGLREWRPLTPGDGLQLMMADRAAAEPRFG
jgi:dTDP-4-dehydrorhamnose reductase